MAIIWVVLGVWLTACLAYMALAYLFGKDQPPDVDDGMPAPWEDELK
jgi:hypothetical protein